MAKAKQLPSGAWRCRPSFTDVNGVRHTASFTAPTKKKAEAMAAAWQEGLIERRNDPKSIPLKEAMEAYIETCRCAGLSPSTIRAYVSYARNAFDMLIDRPCGRITERDVQLWINARSKTVAPKSIRNNLAFLNVVLKSEGVKIDLESLKTPKAQRDEMEIPSDAQVAELLNAVYDDNDMYIAIALAALMGLRRSEICALRWTDLKVQEDVAYLDVSKAMVFDENHTIVEKTPKTKSGYRLLPVPPALLVELKRRRHMSQMMVSITPDIITDRYFALANRLSIPKRFHNLRHYHASVMLREGVPEKYIVADMGHSSFDMVKRVYGHVMKERKEEISSAMAVHAESIICDTNVTRNSKNVNNA